MNCPACGEKGYVIDSRPRGDGGLEMRRRYVCSVCTQRWTSLEFIVVSDHVKDMRLDACLAKKYSSMERDMVADELIALAQKLLHGEG